MSSAALFICFSPASFPQNCFHSPPWLWKLLAFLRMPLKHHALIYVTTEPFDPKNKLAKQSIPLHNLWTDGQLLLEIHINMSPKYRKVCPSSVSSLFHDLMMNFVENAVLMHLKTSGKNTEKWVCPNVNLHLLFSKFTSCCCVPWYASFSYILFFAFWWMIN